jgi:hypothetical protein
VATADLDAVKGLILRAYEGRAVAALIRGAHTK